MLLYIYKKNTPPYIIIIHQKSRFVNPKLLFVGEGGKKWGVKIGGFPAGPVANRSWEKGATPRRAGANICSPFCRSCATRPEAWRAATKNKKKKNTSPFIISYFGWGCQVFFRKFFKKIFQIFLDFSGEL